ncbi:MAG: hypothetical protein ACLVAW_13655 [Eisenbergiella massiliensis]
MFYGFGKPFFSLGGQVHNSSSYPIGGSGRKSRGGCGKVVPKRQGNRGNTIAVPVCWDAFEPEEGVYNTGYVHAIIDAVRSHGLHGILLWFGTWKNGQMEYTPAWVKKDRERFPEGEV